jgi:hypothetical protein
MSFRLLVAGVVVAGVLGGGLGWPAGPAVVRGQEVESAGEAVQYEDPMLQEMMVLSISRESAAYYADLMGLDALQREVALDMHRDYLDQYRQAAVAMRDFMRDFEAKMGEGGADFEKVMGEMMRVAMGFMDRVVVLGTRYVEDLGALAATDEQRAGHERVARTRDREMAAAMTSMGGGNGVVDLIAIGRDLDPPLLPVEGEDPAAQALLEYERELGAACGPFVERALGAFREMMEAAARDGMDAGGEDKIQAEVEAMIERFASTNERYVRRVHNALPAERQAAWDLAYKRARWPEVYAPNNFHRTHDAAMALEGLTSEQREAIAAAMQQYTREADPANKKWIDAIAEAEAVRNRMRTEWSEELWAEMQAKDQASKDAQAARDALDERFTERVMKTLTPEQREAMPETGSGGVDADEVVRQMGGG